MKTGILAVLALALCACAPGSLSQKHDGSAKQLQLARAMEPSIVQVEYHLQFDQGVAPDLEGGERCPNCGAIHSSNASRLIEHERPLVLPGWVMAADRILSPDASIHPRFIREIKIRKGDQVVTAKPVSYAVDHHARLLAPEQPIANAKPLDFSAKTHAKPSHLVSYREEQGRWIIAVNSAGASLALGDDGQAVCTTSSAGVIVDEDGRPLGITTSGRLPADEAWRGSPLKWPSVTASDMDGELAQFAKRADQSLLRVKLFLRSPRADQNEQYNRYRSSSNEEESATEINTLGVLISDRQVLVLAGLKPKVTARLERVSVFPAEGAAVPAKFACSLKDYAALVVELEKPLTGVVTLSTTAADACRDKLMLAANIAVLGEQRTAYVYPFRVAAFDRGWGQQIKPEINLPSKSSLFVFDRDGSLVVASLTRRAKVAVDDRWSNDDPEPIASCYLTDVLAKPAQFADASNLPVSEEEENRIAWLGVELQNLNPDLARANRVAEATQSGETGALVTYVYPDSPAAKAGIETGDILLRLHVAGQPKPIDVKLEDDYAFSERPFPWSEYDQCPEAYFDQIPMPWPNVENGFNRKLTDLGWNTPIILEFARNGVVSKGSLSVVASPAHYNVVPRYKSEPLGLTVHDLSYEVRRYFQKKPTDAGVIVSRVEQGSKASVAGIKPYEIITHVNGEPVKSTAEFAKLASNGELKLTVLRMNASRIARVRLGNSTVASTQPVRGTVAPKAGSTSMVERVPATAPARNVGDLTR